MLKILCWCGVAVAVLLLFSCVTTTEVDIPPGFANVFGPADDTLVGAIHVAATLEDPLLVAAHFTAIAKEYIDRGRIHNASLLLEQAFSLLAKRQNYSNEDLLPNSPNITRHTDSSVVGSGVTVEILLDIAKYFFALEEENATIVLNRAFNELKLIPEGEERAALIRHFIDIALEIGDTAYEQINLAAQLLPLYAHKVTRISLLLYGGTQFIENKIYAVGNDLIQNTNVAIAALTNRWDIFYAALLVRRYQQSNQFPPDIVFSALPPLPQVAPQPQQVNALAFEIATTAPEFAIPFLEQVPLELLPSALTTMLSARPNPQLASQLLSRLLLEVRENPLTHQEEIHIGLVAAIYYGISEAPFAAITASSSAPLHLQRVVEVTRAYRQANREAEALRSYQESIRYLNSTVNIPLETLTQWYAHIIQYDGVDQLLTYLHTTRNASAQVQALIALSGSGLQLTPSQKEKLSTYVRHFR